MKIAICFSGSIRDFRSCYPSMKRYLLDNINADVFMHLWKVDNNKELAGSNAFKWKVDACKEDYVLKELKPVDYVIDGFNADWEKKIVAESGIDVKKFANQSDINYGINACGMYYKIMKAYELAEKHMDKTGVNYDIIIRARLDFIWEDHITPEMFADANDKSIFLIKDRYASHSRLVTNDKFFAGNRVVMKKMCNLFNEIKTYQKRGYKVEGQTLNERHIKESGFIGKWIGHSHTYFKCMGRHTMKNNRKIIFINNEPILASIWFDLAYYFLYRNFNVVFLKKESNEKNLSVLKTFSNFQYIEYKTTGLRPVICYGMTSASTKTQQVIVNPNINAKQYPQRYYTCVNVGGLGTSIKDSNLVDFLVSIMDSARFGKNYRFDKTKRILDFVPNESLRVRYSDRGYYHAKYVRKLPKDKHEVTFNGSKFPMWRANIKIVDIVKYVDKMEPLTMPVN